MQFLFQPLTWGFVLVGVPILVHLINMLRHRKQSWAAMDFLLESYRKHRRWVLLKQWLLLAARILTMFLLVAMLARWISNSQSLGWFGGRVTHHYILLDDSYSMAEQEKDDTAYAKALKAVQSLIRSIATQPGEHQLTLLRWSRAELAARGGKEQARVDVAADLISQTIPQDASRLLDRISASQPSSLQLSPDPALEMIAPLVSANEGEQVEIYVVSDLRRNEWAQPESTKSKLAPLVKSASRVQFIDCADASSSNLGLSALQPEQETWAAGVPLMVKFQITNHGTAPAKNVVVKLRSINYAEGAVTAAPDARYSGEIVDAPPVVIEEIPAGETAMRQVQLVFPTPGQHVVEATLPEDRLPADNHRWCVIGIRQTQQILVIDDSADTQTQFFLRTALQPDGRQATGMSVDVRDAAYLRDATPEALASWDVIVLIEGPTLDPSALARLENYIKTGGGLAFIAGPSTTQAKVNEYYRAGAGFFPSQISAPYETNIRPGNTEPQVTATDHPILAPLKSLQTSPFQLIEVRKMLELTTSVANDTDVEVVAWGPDKRPLVIDKTYGEGHVIIMLTGLVSDAAGGGRLLNREQQVAWSNWAQDPTFVVFALRTMGYLGSFRRAETSEPVGTTIATSFAGTTLLPGAELLLPAKNENARAKLSLTAEQATPDQPVKIEVPVDLSQDNDAIEGLLRPGVFEFWMQTTDGGNLVRNMAHNVPAGEGNLARVSRTELEETLSPIKITIQSADSLSSAAWSPEAASYSTLLFALLVLLLLAEQTLAYSASYHVPKVTKPGIGVA